MGRWVALAAAFFMLATQAAQAATSHVLTAEDVDAWLDGLLPYAHHEGDIAGSVVIVVKDGQVLTERGFGYADVAQKIPMDPRRTLIRPGSVSKLFTWTSVMQLVERGTLDLDTDVNRYLDFTIPSFEGQPLTLRNIMTHTSGFEESLKDLGSKGPPPRLEDYVKTHLPQRIYPPGKVPAYSNYATALAGYIVQRVSGVEYNEYVQQYILTPLGMSSSTFRQPPPPELAVRMSNGYSVASGAPGYYENIGPGPAGSLAATADDMGRFMIAHLQNGRLGDARILSEQTAVQMHAPQPRIYPALNAMALGFYETSRNEHRIITHNGGTQFFHSDLHLFVDDGVGLFISFNSTGKEGAAPKAMDVLFHEFTDRYFPAVPEAPLASLNTARSHAALMAGTWENSRRSASTFWSIVGFLGVLTLTANDDGTLTVPIPSHGPMLFQEIAPFVWASGAEKIQALVRDGRPVMLGFGMAPPAAFLPQPWYRSAGWLMPALAIALVVLVVTAISWPIAVIARRTLKVATLARGTAVAVVAVTLLFGFVMVYMSNDLSRMSSGADGWILALEAAALIVFPGAVLAGAWNLWRAPNKLGASLFLASCCLMLWGAAALHLMSLRTNY